MPINYQHILLIIILGANYLFPEDWAAYEAAIPVEERGDYLLAYGRRLRGELGEEGKGKNDRGG